MTATTLPFIQTKPVQEHIVYLSPPDKPLSRKIATWFTYFSAFPIYALLFAIQNAYPTCDENRTYYVIFGVFCITEICMAHMVFPAKFLCMKCNGPEMDFEENDRRIQEHRQMSITQKVHGFVTAFLPLIIFSPAIVIPQYRAENLVILGIPLLVTLHILRAVVENRWMPRLCNTTCVYSTITQLIGTSIMILGVLHQDYFYFTISLLVFLGVVLYLRFVDLFTDPPQNKCVFSYRIYRYLLVGTFGWFLMVFCMFWAGINLFFIIGYEGVQNQCQDRVATALFVFIGLVPTFYAVAKIVRDISEFLNKHRK